MGVAVEGVEGRPHPQHVDEQETPAMTGPLPRLPKGATTDADESARPEPSQSLFLPEDCAGRLWRMQVSPAGGQASLLPT